MRSTPRSSTPRSAWQGVDPGDKRTACRCRSPSAARRRRRQSATVMDRASVFNWMAQVPALDRNSTRRARCVDVVRASSRWSWDQLLGSRSPTTLQAQGRRDTREAALHPAARCRHAVEPADRQQLGPDRRARSVGQAGLAPDHRSLRSQPLTAFRTAHDRRLHRRRLHRQRRRSVRRHRQLGSACWRRSRQAFAASQRGWKQSAKGRITDYFTAAPACWHIVALPDRPYQGDSKVCRRPAAARRAAADSARPPDGHREG